MAHESGPPAAVHVAPERQDPLLTSCDQSVVCTIFSSRAPSTRLLYANRWKLFSQWCVARGKVPGTCSVVVILHFLQSVLDNRRAASTLPVYMAAISATHARVDNHNQAVSEGGPGASTAAIPEGTIMGPASSSEVLMSTPI